MRLQSGSFILYQAFGALALWATVNGQGVEPRIALKLTDAAHAKQQDDPNFITSLVQRTQPQSLRPSNPKVDVDKILKSQRFEDLESRVPPSNRLAKPALPNFDAWYNIRVELHPGASSRRATDNGAPANHTGVDNPTVALPADTLDLIHRLHKLAEVESVHALYPGPPPSVNPSDDPRSVNQGYLNAAPEGINARYAWGVTGGDGTGVNIIDVEQGWNFNHEDLVAAGVTLISGRNEAYFSHGTSVLGEMVMVDNTIGGIGIIPNAKVRAVSQHREDFTYNTADAILDAAAHLTFGDIILIEAQEFDPVSGVYYWPVEIADANFDAIQVATALGITVVQAGCNGAYDLDAYVNLDGKHIFDRSSPDFRDSGAIMVGGSTFTVPHSRWYSSNYGSRIDVYAWAESIDTSDSDDDVGSASYYTSWFGGTSGASPIIVSASAIIQGLSLAQNNVKLAPAALREILSNPANNGTATANPSVDRIGVMPNLQTIIDTHFNGTNPGSGCNKKRVKRVKRV
ncbi:peptidase S8/S53 domain-containing protein [Dichotomopilus funicola]|uniref:Peptidase S8/S53 domain-containing protein n=1 Tax=Dichotomopilus funicola TaxID=1934379 RepID=A0AAN6V0Y5_9PEZI|nr:peptidase S8/S53 domain-containing protein [Dichotomopilus funicola]